jgi:hypothetical protein
MCLCVDTYVGVPVQVAKHVKPSAFVPMTPLTPHTDCGWGGMDVQQCWDRGCTWKPAAPSSAWCTYQGPNKKTLEDTMVEEPF